MVSSVSLLVMVMVTGDGWWVTGYLMVQSLS